MTIDVLPDRIPLRLKERDVLTIMHGVLEAARLLRRSTRQVRRLQRTLRAHGDSALMHGLRGKPSHRRLAPALRAAVLQAYRDRYVGFGPIFASETVEGEGLHVGPQTLRRWLIAEGLWQRQRRRDPHRACFGELVQRDASEHDWREGRGEAMVLITMIDDAASYLLARFDPAGTTEAHWDLLGRWLRRHGRPVAWYTDRHSIFEPQ